MNSIEQAAANLRQGPPLPYDAYPAVFPQPTETAGGAE